jgi:hypothetical protein
MPTFGTKSKRALQKVDSDLVRVLEHAIIKFDFSVVWGYRNEAQQNEMYANGATRNPWPTSNHNHKPSRATDIVPYPGGYNATYREFCELATYIYAAANELDIHIEWGGHWLNYTGQGFDDRDWAHWELK